MGLLRIPANHLPRHKSRHLFPDATQVMIVYALSDGCRRRVIDADSDLEYKLHQDMLHPGEGFFMMSHDDYDAFGDKGRALALNDHTAKMAGFDKAPDFENGRHVVVDPNGTVINVVHADLTCGDCGDHFGEDHKLVFHPTAEIGSTFIADEPASVATPKGAPDPAPAVDVAPAVDPQAPTASP